MTAPPLSTAPLSPDSVTTSAGAGATGVPGAAPPLTRLAHALGLFALIGWSFGVVVGALVMKGPLDRFLQSNAVGTAGRKFLLLLMVAGAVVALALAAVAYWRMRKSPGGLARFHEAARRLSPLALIGFLPFLFRWRTWIGRETTFVYLVAIFSLAVAAAVKSASTSPPLALGPRARASWARVSGWLAPVRDVLALRRWPWLPLLIAVATAAIYAAMFAAFTLTFHRNLHTAAYDLGGEDNLVWNALHGHFFRSTPFTGPAGSSFGTHANFLAFVIAPFYALAPGAGTLLVIQSLLIGAAAIPLFLFARRHVGPWPACLIAIGYLLYPPTHGANLYEFHYQPLGAFFLWMTLFLFETRRDRLGVVFAILSLSVGEDMGGVGVAVLGGYLLLTGERPRIGLVLAIAGMAEFVLLRLVLMPSALGGDGGVTFYRDLVPFGQPTFGDVLRAILHHPFYVLNGLMDRDKLFYVLELLVPLAFLPLRRPLFLLLVIPGFLFTVLASGHPPLIQTSFQYTFYWIIFLFIGVVAALDRRGAPALSDAEHRLRKRAGLVAFACAMLAMSYQSGAIFQRHTARGGFAAYIFETTARDLADRKALAEIVPQIPPRAKVAASDNLVPQISSRPAAYPLRTSFYDAEYLLFFSDQTRQDGQERARVMEALTSGQFGVVAIRPPFALARRGQPTASNDNVLMPWGMRMPVLPPGQP